MSDYISARVGEKGGVVFALTCPSLSPVCTCLDYIFLVTNCILRRVMRVTYGDFKSMHAIIKICQNSERSVALVEVQQRLVPVSLKAEASNFFCALLVSVG